jgi:hypothetical protein
MVMVIPLLHLHTDAGDIRKLQNNLLCVKEAQVNIESGQIDGDFEVTEDLQLHGMIGGSAIVKNGALLQVH